jgi:class 3 adenylate cyclase/CHASE3 domain sensor protein
MRLFKHLKLQAKLLLLFSLVVLVGTLGVGMTINFINQLNTEMNDLAVRTRDLAVVAQVKTQIHRQQESVNEYVATDKIAALDQYIEARQLAIDALDQAIASAKTAADDQAVEDKTADEFTREPVNELNLLMDVREDLTDYNDAVYEAILGPYETLVAEALDDDAAYALIDSEHERLEQIYTTLDRVSYSYTLESEDARTFGEQITVRGITFGMIVLVLFTALAVVAALVTNNIADPVLNLTNAIVAFESDAYRPDMLSGYTNRPDELGKLANAVDHMAQSITEYSQRQRRMLEGANRFVPVAYVDFLAKDDITQIQLGDHVSAQMPIMWTDIRSFSALSEKMTAAENFQFINDYLKTISPAIREHDGAIVKFVGDGMLSVFPFGVEDALQAAITQFELVAEMNRKRKEQGIPTTGLSIGLHYGPMMLGMVGEETRMQGDAFSDNVNLTNRIEGLNKFFGSTFVMSEELYREIDEPERYEIRKVGKVQVKGRQTPLMVYEVLSGDVTNSGSLKIETRAPFEQALRLWWNGAFDEALPLFEQVSRANPEDASARYYCTEAARLVAEGAPAKWDGVLVMVSK